MIAARLSTRLKWNRSAQTRELFGTCRHAHGGCRKSRKRNRFPKTALSRLSPFLGLALKVGK
jgi:hypothetical protein